MDDDQTTQLFDLGVMTNHKWRGKLSAIHTKVDYYSITESLEQFYVEVAPQAKTRCIDGRHDPRLDEGHLGAQVPGGAPGAALAYRLGVDRDDLTRGTFYNDAETMIDSFIRLGLTPGGHRDDQGNDGAVGCGAIDNMAAIITNLTDPNLVEDHKRLVKLLLGADFDRDIYLRVLGAATVLRCRSEDYFNEGGAILDVLEAKAPGSVSTLEGEHREALVLVNLVPNTTLASNRFAEQFGVQAFGYDLWRSKEFAHLLLPLPIHEQDYRRFVMARVMITVATLMTLTDGSLRLLLRLPSTPVADES